MKIVLTHALSRAGMRVLEEAGFELYVANSADHEQYMEQLKEADGFIIRVGYCDAGLIDRCPNLKVIGRTGVGYDNVAVAHAVARGIPTVFTPGANHRSVAEHCVAMMFSLAKNLPEADQELRRENWNIRDAGKAIELSGKKIGIVGVGAIGRIVAELCRALGMKTAGFSHSQNRKKVEEAGCEYYASLQQLLQECDVISLHIPLNPQTKDLITAPELALMKRTALLINTSRGEIVNEADLADALNRDVIAGAGVDVYSFEPAKADNPLFQAKNLILTPHSAALTLESLGRMSVQCAKGCVAVLRGERWADVVDQRVYAHQNFD